jgi:hypothetical protein|eukprot:COSAG01_NODE_911_length_12783_cov_145.960817_1_plen_39_part_00
MSGTYERGQLMALNRATFDAEPPAKLQDRLRQLANAGG